MQITTVSSIVSHQVLNNETGELETKDFKELKQSKRMRGGFRMVYKKYDEVVIEVCKSQLDIKLLVYIRDIFTYNNIDQYISAAEVADHFGITRQKTSGFIKKLLDVDLVRRSSRKRYRLNPFMYIPYKADAAMLQAEWNELSKQQVYKIIDETPKELVAVTRDDIAKLGANGFTLLIQAGFKAGMSVERQWEVYNLVSK